MISRTKIGKRIGRKSDNYVVDTALISKKQGAWMKVAQIISGPRQNYKIVNLKQLDAEAKEGDTIVIPGKVLGTGKITKKLCVCALYFSESAAEKLNEKKCEMKTVMEEIKKNPKAEGVKIWL